MLQFLQGIVIPTPVAPLMDTAAVITDAWAFMPIVISVVLPFLGISLGWHFAKKSISTARATGKR